MKQSNKIANHLISGSLGEEIVENYLKNKGFTIIQKNYRKPWGEIDIISKMKNVYHFVEVKTVSYKTFDQKDENFYNPEDNVTKSKLQKLSRVIDTYLKEHAMSNNFDWQIDLVAVRINETNKKAYIKYFPSISNDDFS